MTPDPSLFVKRIRQLSWALAISGAFNIGILSIFLYWVLRERPPTPYCELKPATAEQQQIPLADCRECYEVLNQLSQLPFPKLVDCLSHKQHIENGYAERDLALACLMAFYHFDTNRALPKQIQPRQKRLLGWKPKVNEEPIILTVYPDLTQHQFDCLIQFAQKEHWPFTPQGLFLLLKKERQEQKLDPHLSETFLRTSEFWTIELLFKRSGQEISKDEILTVLLDGQWETLQSFVNQQRQLNDQSAARRQKFLVDYLMEGSSMAALLLLKVDGEFASKKLDDSQVIALLKHMPQGHPETERYAKEMLTSPRSSTVWHQASRFLYMQSGEEMPKNWDYQMALERFVSDRIAIVLPTSKHVVNPAPSKAVSSPISKRSMGISEPLPKQNPNFHNKPLFQTYSDKPSVKAQAPKDPSTVYVIQEGDSLWKIARKHRVSIDKIKEHNQMKSDKIKPGMTLKIPSN